MNRVDFLIVGGGISGLSTAWFLRELGFSVRVLEAADNPGGCLQSRHEAGFLLEEGPNSTLENNLALGELIRGLGLDEHLLEANPLAKRRYVQREGVLHPLPGGPGALIKTPLFSARGKLRLLAEPFIGRARKEESVAEFVRRRLGRDFLDWAIDPFVSGVYAGDPARLSVRAATAKVYALERDYRSLIIGALKKFVFNRHRGGAGPAGRMVSFDEGMQLLPRTLAGQLGEELECGVRVDSLEREHEGWTASAGDRFWQGRQVVLALPAHRAAGLLAPLDADLAAELESIVYPPVASVALGFRRDQVAHPLDGFGFLIPRKEGVETLGCLFSSTLFPGRAPEGHVLLTAFIGGRQNPAIAERDQADILAQVRADLAAALGIEGEPVMSRVKLWPRAIPQYELGYPDKLARIDERLSRQPGLHVRANWRDGISVADCVKNARDFAERFKAAD